MNYYTAWGDSIPCRDSLDDGCEFEYEPTKGKTMKVELSKEDVIAALEKHVQSMFSGMKVVYDDDCYRESRAWNFDILPIAPVEKVDV